MVIALMLFFLLVSANAQNLGSPIIIQPQFNNASGIPLALGKLCSYAAGTSTPLATYSERTLTTQNSNPMILTAGGLLQQQIYLDAVAYKFVLRTAGSDNTCSTGTVIGTWDYQYDIAALYRSEFATKLDDKVCHASQYTGTTPNNMGGKVKTCYDALPGTGGTIDARGLEGAQVWTTTLTCSKPVTILLGASTIAVSNQVMVNGAGCVIVGLGQGISIVSIATGIDGFNPGTGTVISNLTIQGPGTVSAGNSCIDSGSAFGVIVEMVTIMLCGDHGINTGQESSRWIIRNNYFLDNQNNHVLIASGSSKNTVNGNVFNNTSSTVGNNCVDMNGSGNIVTSNYMINCGREGGAIDDWAALIQALPGFDANDNIIADNYMEGCGAQCVIIRSIVGQTASNNIISGNSVNTAGSKTAGSGEGITIDGTATGTMDGNKIIGNVVRNCTSHGVIVNGVGSTITKTSIIGNTIHNNAGTGLYIFGANAINTKASGNVVYSNGTNLDLSGSVNTDGLPDFASYVTFTDGDATPTVSGNGRFKTGNSMPTSVTDLDDGLSGQSVTIVCGDGNTTFVDGGNLILAGDFVCTISSTITLIQNSNGSEWFEISRSSN